MSVLGGNVVGGVIAVGLGVGAIVMGRTIGINIGAVQLTNTAVQHLTRGNVAEAEALLTAIAPQATKRGVVARAVATLRAMIALYEGRLEESVRYATAAIEGKSGLFTGAFESRQIAGAHAFRGLAYAALGNTLAAKADADAAENSVDATPEVIARARVVRAMTVSRAAYHEEAFREYLASNARLVLEHAMPRERALFRALRRMSRSPQRSVYREQGRVKDDLAPSKLASWIAYVAPDAAEYVEGDRMLADRVDEEAVPSGVPSDVRALRDARATARSAPRPGGLSRRLVALLGVLFVLLVAIWQLQPHGAAAVPVPEPQDEPSSLFVSIVINVAPIAFLGAIFVGIMSFLRRHERTLALALRHAALGRRAEARPTLERLVAGRSNGMIAATAGLELARLAAAEANFAETISRCDAAISRVSAQPLRAAAADLLLPALYMESAVATAARGGLEEADAELAVLCRDFPTYSQLPAAQLRVKLIRAVRSGDRDAACAVARSRTAELPLPYREDVLADLVLASRKEVSEAEQDRLDTELKDDPELRAWINAVGPGLIDDRPTHLRQQRLEVPIAEEASDASEDDIAEGRVRRS